MTDEIEEKLRAVIAKNLKVDAALIQPSSTLGDWGGDSLDFIETLAAIEANFDVSLPETLDPREVNFARLIEMIQDQISNKAS